jgi:uncharacterized protein (TIGR00375 family)
MSCPEITEKLLEIDDKIEIIPAHSWTPWFGVFGSMSGFNSLKEAFHEYAGKIHAIETGMSSDPKMNWRLSELNEKTIISFSDAHSFWPFRMGREATIFEGDIQNFSYKQLITQIRKNEILGTIETDPAYGKYHFDGHRLCNFSCSPEEAIRIKNICPVCHKPLTIGVEHRVEELADNPLGFEPKNAKPFYKILPLHELISLAKNSSLTSKRVWQEYNKIISASSEFHVLLKSEKNDLAKLTDDKMIDLIMQNRQGKINVTPGFDGVYGEARLSEKQQKLF